MIFDIFSAASFNDWSAWQPWTTFDEQCGQNVTLTRKRECNIRIPWAKCNGEAVETKTIIGKPS